MQQNALVAGLPDCEGCYGKPEIGGLLLCAQQHDFSEMLGEDEDYQRLKNAKIAAEKALQSVISQESWKQYLALDEICNELECARYKAMYLAGAADYEKISK